jgi:hypothetical protein
MAASPTSSASVSLTYYGHGAFLFQTIEEWLVTRSRVRHLGSPVMSLSPSSLPDAPETWVFAPDPASFEAARIDP